MIRKPSRIAIIGDSHSAALGTFHRKRGAIPVPLEVIQFKDARASARDFATRGEDGSVALHPEASDAIRSLGLDMMERASPEGRSGDFWLLMQLGTHFFVTMLLAWRNGDFNTELPFDSPEPLEGPLVPHEAIVARTSRDLDMLRRGLEFLKAEFPDRLAVFHAPPPHRENALIDRFTRSALSLPASRRVGFPAVDHVVWPRASVRLKVQWVYHCALRDVCAELDIPFHDVWEKASSPDGFLREEYCFDGFHGNTRYAGLVMNSFVERYY